MAINDAIEKYLPLSEATFYILAVLVEPMHGYALMQRVEEISAGKVKIGPGTLYGAFGTLEKEGLIVMVREADRRKYYQATEKGAALLREQVARLELMWTTGQASLRLLDGRSK